MVVRAQIPSKTGYSLRAMTVQEARLQLTKLLQKGWLIAVNGVLTRDINRIVDGTEVRIYLAAGGG
ncbi:MAG: hypothetical protein ACXADB_14035 [Candidatus Hermodarchaeia archaeon]